MSSTNGMVPAAEICPSGQELEIPFLRAKQAWDEREGAILHQKANWQRYALAAMLLCLMLGGVVVYLAGNVTVLPYVVEVAESGQIRTVGILPQVWRGHDTHHLAFVTREWLQWVRQIPSDQVAFVRQWEKAHQFMTRKARTTLEPFLKDQYARQQRGETVEITPGAFLPIAGHAQSYQVEWEERVYDPSGQVQSKTTWLALLHIVVYPPQVVQDAPAMHNPLGIFLESVQWAERTRRTP